MSASRLSAEELWVVLFCFVFAVVVNVAQSDAGLGDEALLFQYLLFDMQKSKQTFLNLSFARVFDRLAVL